MMKDYYAVLGVSRKADSTAIKSAYERKVQRLSRLTEAERAAEEKVLKEAFENLSNPFKREDLDAHLVEIDANLGGATSNTPLVVGIVVVLLTIGGVGYFLTERWKSQQGARAEQQRYEKSKAAAREPVIRDR
ncbi:MAG: DnaJ domain-containing protein [Ilumatobacteraceae bacterium]